MKFFKVLNKIIRFRFLLIVFSVMSIVFIGVSRFTNIEADTDVSISKLQGAYVTDEGWKSGNAINKVISNKWICDDMNDMFLWPIMPLITYTSFKLFGLSLFSLRLPFVVFSTLLLCLMGLSLSYSQQKTKGNNFLLTMLLYLFLAGTNYFLYIQGRVAFIDIPMNVFGLAGLLILYTAIKSKARKKKYLLFILHGILIGFCLCVKTTGLIFLISSIMSLLLLKVINISNHKSDFRGLILSLFSTICVVFLILYVVNFIIVGSFITVPLKYIFNQQVINSSQFNPLLIIKNYLRFFTNNVLIYNSALFLIMLVSLIIILQKSIKSRNLAIIDSVMLSLTISSFLFLGYFTPQAERYFTILLIPMLYFVPKVVQSVADYCNKKQYDKNNKHVHIKKGLLIIIILIIFSNTWNMWKLEDYLHHKNYTLKNMAFAIKRDIETDIKKQDAGYTYCMFGMPTSTLAVINQMPFVYHPNYDSGNYYYITNEPSEFDDAKYTFISKYVLFNFPNPECCLYLLKSINCKDEM